MEYQDFQYSMAETLEVPACDSSRKYDKYKRVDGGPKRRATLACLRCRKRKVRCNVVEEKPCMNCRLDGIDCTTVGRKGGRTRGPSFHFEQMFATTAASEDIQAMMAIQEHSPAPSDRSNPSSCSHFEEHLPKALERNLEPRQNLAESPATCSDSASTPATPGCSFADYLQSNHAKTIAMDLCAYLQTPTNNFQRRAPSSPSSSASTYGPSDPANTITAPSNGNWETRKSIPNNWGLVNEAEASQQGRHRASKTTESEWEYELRLLRLAWQQLLKDNGPYMTIEETRKWHVVVSECLQDFSFEGIGL